MFLDKNNQVQVFHWHLEVSSKCALKCPRCPRTEFPETTRLNKELSLSDIQSLFNREVLGKTARITFCGDVGDPIYATHFISIVRYLKEQKPDVEIYIITNGSYKKSHWWAELAQILNEYDTIAFSIDGYDQATNQLYRVGSDWESTVEGLKIMSEQSRAMVLWALIVFKFNEDKIEKIMNFAKEIGVDEFQITKSIKFGKRFNIYKDKSGFDNLEPSEAWISNGNKYERQVIKLSKKNRPQSQYLKKIQSFYSEGKKNFFDKAIFPMCVTGNRGVFVTADGQLWPCAWVSFPHAGLQSPSRPKKLIHFEDSFFMQNKDKLNIRKRNLTDIFSDPLWDKLADSFKSHDKMFIECEKKCLASNESEGFTLSYFTD